MERQNELDRLTDRHYPHCGCDDIGDVFTEIRAKCSGFPFAGRCAGRYVLSMGNIASALAVTGLIAYVEVHYKTGFAIAFWHSLLAPLGIVLGLYGYCTYRFRETRAMSMGQFLEMRYNLKSRFSDIHIEKK